MAICECLVFGKTYSDASWEIKLRKKRVPMRYLLGLCVQRLVIPKVGIDRIQVQKLHFNLVKVN